MCWITVEFLGRLEASVNRCLLCGEHDISHDRPATTIRDERVDESVSKDEDVKENSSEEEKKEEIEIVRSKSPKIVKEEKSRTKTEIEAELFALRMCRRFKAASIRMARAKRDTSKIHATLQCRIKGLENELRSREEALQVAGLECNL